MTNANLILNAYVAVEHFTRDISATISEGYVEDAGLQAVPVNIQPTSAYLTALYGGAYGKLYTIFTVSSGILETDRITTVSGNLSTAYIVKGKQFFNYGYAQHTELYCEETE